jgi:hypothetical protein
MYTLHVSRFEPGLTDVRAVLGEDFMTYRKALAVATVMVAVVLSAYAADPTGKWTATFDTQIGQQKYTYDFKADGEKLTGKAISQFGETEIEDGKVKGDDISFVENITFQDQKIRIEYQGKIAGDEIKFTRKVGDFATEELVAKRVK